MSPINRGVRGADLQSMAGSAERDAMTLRAWLAVLLLIAAMLGVQLRGLDALLGPPDTCEPQPTDSMSQTLPE